MCNGRECPHAPGVDRDLEDGEFSVNTAFFFEPVQGTSFISQNLKGNHFGWRYHANESFNDESSVDDRALCRTIHS